MVIPCLALPWCALENNSNKISFDYFREKLPYRRSKLVYSREKSEGGTVLLLSIPRSILFRCFRQEMA